MAFHEVPSYLLLTLGLFEGVFVLRKYNCGDAVNAICDEECACHVNGVMDVSHEYDGAKENGRCDEGEAEPKGIPKDERE